MIRATIALAILFASCNHIHQTGFTEKQSDSVINIISNAIRPNLERMEYGAALHYLDSVQPHVYNLKDNRIKSAWLTNKGATFMYNNEFDSADKYFRMALVSAEQVKSDSMLWITAQSMLMNSFARQNKFDSSLRYGLACYQLASKVDTTTMAKIGSVLSEVYDRMGDTANRRKYLFESYKYARTAKMKMLLANNIAKYYYDLGNVDSAIAFNNRVDVQRLFAGNYEYQSGNLGNIGILLTAKGDLKNGLSYLKQSADLNNKYNMQDENLYLNIADNYSRQKNISQANLYSDSALQLARAKGNLTSISNAFKQFSDNERIEKKYEEAYKTLDSSIAYYSKNDSISYVKSAQELETRYATKAKDQQIAQLGFENDTNKKIEGQQRVIIIAIAGAFLFMALAAILFWRRRQLKVQLREAELTQQLLTSQMEPHFLFNMMATLQNYVRKGDQQTKIITYFEKLSLLLRSVFENAHKNFVPLKSELSIVESYLSLQSMQSNNTFVFKIENSFADQQEHILVPSMLLQPLVENAVLHGVSNLNRQGLIQVSVSKISDMIQYEVIDNGTGPTGVSTIHSTKVHATDLIKERLTLLGRKTGHTTKFEVSSNNGEGTKVLMLVPFIVD